MNFEGDGDAVHQLPSKPLSKKNIFLPFNMTAALFPEKITPFVGACRPFMGRCCEVCTPDSWGLFETKVQSLRFHNIIHVTENSTRYRGWLVRRVCHLLFVWGLKVHPYNSENITECVLNTARVRNVLSSGGPNSENCSISKILSSQREAVAKILTRIKSSILPLILRLVSFTLLKVFRCVFLNIQVHLGQVEMVRRAPQMYKSSVVYLSIHKSCLDYLLLPFVLFCNGLRVPYFAAGGDLRTSTFRFILQKLGGIFLPQRCTDSAGRCIDPITRTVLTSVSVKLLQDNCLT
ncbi:glycerol-3-phosphate acyltransferase 1, mitochondrial-like [Protopterus annectens]|uniref:glycerol-3-phosphate acyltransferase 1, mitochondrial-like n=1 Tax=Protopterus annectens TaxID=7888 RepID=UPI001CFB96F5|nr:glycerol-3-phosphate acyltransferase 1, mitochondrial-like [Protopterus annectens]